METDEVLALLRRVGEECVDPRFGTLGSGDVDRKQLRAPVTAADREAEQRLTEELTRAHPGAVVVGEEAVAADPGWSRGPSVPSTPSSSTRSTGRGSSSRARPTTR